MSFLTYSIHPSRIECENRKHNSNQRIILIFFSLSNQRTNALNYFCFILFRFISHFFYSSFHGVMFYSSSLVLVVSLFLPLSSCKNSTLSFYNVCFLFVLVFFFCRSEIGNDDDEFSSGCQLRCFAKNNYIFVDAFTN